jgi:hypothetical protein
MEKENFMRSNAGVKRRRSRPLGRDVRTAARYPTACQHDTAALHARQCRNGCGLRAASERLTIKATLPKTAHATEHEDAKCAHARETRKTTWRAKNRNAGQPGAMQREAKT